MWVKIVTKGIIMKKRLLMSLILVGYCLNSSFLCHADPLTSGAESLTNRSLIQIRPTTTGENSIVDAIKYYSNLTESYANQYKFVPLGDVGTLGAFVLGLYSLFMTGHAAAGVSTGYAGNIQNMLKTNVGGYSLPEGAQKLMQNPATLVVMGVLGGGLASYKLLYPRTRMGVLENIDQFIDVCRSLERPDGMSIVQYKFQDVSSLRGHLPQGWGRDDMPIYNALNNLALQAIYANALLNQIKNVTTLLRFAKDDIAEIQRRAELIDTYAAALQNNKNLMETIVGPELKRRADLANLKADTELKTAGKWALYGSMAKGTVSSIWNGIKELYAHPEILAILGLGWVTTKYLTPSK